MQTIIKIFISCLFCLALSILIGCNTDTKDDWQMPTHPPAAAGVKPLMKRGHLALEESDWKQATHFFDRTLDIDPEYAPAYIGKLCADLKIPSETQLGDSALPISDLRNFQLALRFADARYKATLEGYVKKIEQARQQTMGDAGKRMTLTINGVEYAFRWCPPGRFMMGDEPGEVPVTLSSGFWLLETQVTLSVWLNETNDSTSFLMRSDGSAFVREGHSISDGENIYSEGQSLDVPAIWKHPATSVSWNDCQEFIKELNTHLAGTPVAPAGFKFSLPTEAQWEYACRAGTTTAYHFGNSLSAEQANFGSDGTKEVGSYPANAWGLRDMHGNVWEWCQDWYGDYPSGAVTDPTGAVRGSRRIFRGGSYATSAEYCRSAFRVPSGGPIGVLDKFVDVGFRLALVRAE